ncbi:prolyl oligopeptidase family serine peptidase [Sphingobacterium faecium]|uniref:alpha/beta hydrolase family protein n=1 Tax=Sphingobacterium faecium TaxID=34087 RepID=UPI001291CAC7|nr:alpha/beta hydrolase [Sphingobacterium faecium]MQP26253.1 prolyl oligopeptidase family serine peptidase [Sphingobacterium faecium]
MVKNIISLFLLLLSTITVFPQNFAGSWKGMLKVGNSNLTFVIHLSEEAGLWKATADSPDQGAFGIPAQAHINGNGIEVVIHGGITYIGKIEQENIIGGEFQQGAFRARLDLTKTEDISTASKVKISRSQRIVPPYNYDTVDVNFRNKYDDVLLSGTLTSPKQKGKFAAVVLVTGSGPQDRNETLMGHEPFRILSDFLTKNNIVVLRYDDRGVGLSQGSFINGTIENFSKDAMAAIEFLKKRPNVDPNKIGIIGHSEGGLIAELLAGQKLPSLSFIVSLAGPAIPIDSLMVSQLYRIGKVAGMNDLALAHAQEINRKNFEIVKSNKPHKEAMAMILDNMKIDPAQLNSASKLELETLLLPSYRYFMRIDPIPFIKKITIPVYAAFGSLDVQVPAEQNLNSLKSNLPTNPKTVLKEYEGLNHLFQKASTGAVSEYEHISETINNEVLLDLVKWIHALN